MPRRRAPRQRLELRHLGAQQRRVRDRAPRRLLQLAQLARALAARRRVHDPVRLAPHALELGEELDLFGRQNEVEVEVKKEAE